MDDIHKKRAYPINVQIDHPKGSSVSKIIKIEKVGFYVEDNSLILASGTRCRVKFSLLGQNVLIETDVLLVRTVDSMLHFSGKDRVARLLEFHFIHLNESASAKIEGFIKSLGQK